jgi:hypothetical protein
LVLSGGTGIDDIRFGGPKTFGGPIRRPTLDALAANGLRFNKFHTTALCSTDNRPMDRRRVLSSATTRQAR